MRAFFRLSLLIALCVAVDIARADTPQTLFSDGFDLLKGGKAKEAAAKFEVGLKADPKNALAHYFLGEAYLALKRDADAKREFQRSLALDATSSVADKARDRLTQLSPPLRTDTQGQPTSEKAKGPSAQETVAFINELMGCEARSNVRITKGGRSDESRSETWSSASLDGSMLIVKNWFRLFSKSTSSVPNGPTYSNQIANISVGNARIDLPQLNQEISDVEVENTNASTAATKHQQAWGKFGEASIDQQRFLFVVSCLANADCIEVSTKNAQRTNSSNPIEGERVDSVEMVAKWTALSRDEISEALRDEAEKFTKGKETFFYVCDEDKANRMRRAFAHLIQISGGKKAPPPLF